MKKFGFLNQENKNLSLNIIGAFFLKGISLMISICSMPLYIKYFKNNMVLGIWYTILSILSWISIFDLGLGNGLRNKLTIALTLNDKISAKKYISSSYIILIKIIIPVVIFSCIIISYIDCNKLLNIPINYISKEALNKSFVILILGISLSFILKLINNIVYALQLSAINNLITLVSSVLPLVYILFFEGNNSNQNFIRLSIVHILSINLPLIFATIICFKSSQMKECKPSFYYYDRKIANSLLKLGIKFFGAQLFFMFLMTTNEFLIARMYSPQKIIEYSVYYKIFTVLGSLFTLALTPLWSKITRDLTMKNYKILFKTINLLYILAGLGLLAGFFVVPILQILVNFWLGSEAIKISTKTAYIFAIYGGIFIFNIVVTTIANGIGDLHLQILFYGIGAILKIPIILIINKFINSWESIIIYNTIVLLLFCGYQMLYLREKIRKYSL